MSVRTLGVEEELHLLDPASRHPVAAVEEVIGAVSPPTGAQVEQEIKRSMIETGTSVCTDAPELAQDLRALRAGIVAAAEDRDLAVASCGLLPTNDWRTSELVDDDRYNDMADLYRQVFDEQVVCGLHVHVGMDDREVGVQVINRIGPWLAPLLALSASSPIHESRDTGFASFRTLVFGRWSTAALPGPLEDVAAHDQLVDELLATGTILDEGQIYWPVRLSSRYPTIEFRVADAVPSVDEAVLQAVLVRAIVSRLAGDVEAGRGVRLPYTDTPGRVPRGELARAATWQAARFGMEGELLELRGLGRLGAHEALRALARQLHAELAATGDDALVADLLDRVERGGAPAQRMQDAFGKGGAKGVTDLVVRETAGR